MSRRSLINLNPNLDVTLSTSPSTSIVLQCADHGNGACQGSIKTYICDHVNLKMIHDYQMIFMHFASGFANEGCAMGNKRIYVINGHEFVLDDDR